MTVPTFDQRTSISAPMWARLGSDIPPYGHLFVGVQGDKDERSRPTLDMTFNPGW
jgi:hypothetical protein